MTKPSTAFSIVIPTQGSRPSLRDTVESVLQQAYRDLQLIVVSDGEGIDAGILLKDVTDPRLRLVSQDHKGVAAARNYGISLCTHPWVAFLDDDDRARPHWLSSFASAIGERSLAVTAGVCFWSNGQPGEDRWCRLSTNDATMGASTILAGGFAVRRDLLRAIGGYDEGLKASENQDLGLRLCDYITTSGIEGQIESIDRVVVDVFVEQAAKRDLRYGDLRSDAAQAFLARYPQRLARDPTTAASLFRIIARRQRLRGDYTAARSAALRAFFLKPTDIDNIQSLVLALAPGVERRIRNLLGVVRRGQLRCRRGRTAKGTYS